jgi:dTDP-4-dehydrorhamnose 3,5-epimerase
MPFHKTGIEGLVLFEPKVFGDHRGYFYESYNKAVFEEGGIEADFVQDNISFSRRGVLRGLHYQLNPYAQAKLVRVNRGEVLDVVVDIRKSSPTYGKSYTIVLNDENKLQLFVPRGFAHGFVVLSEEAEFCYKCDNFYSKEHEAGIIYDDPTLNIEWKIPAEEAVLSDKDKVLPALEQAQNNFE